MRQCPASPDFWDLRLVDIARHRRRAAFFAEVSLLAECCENPLLLRNASADDQAQPSLHVMFVANVIRDMRTATRSASVLTSPSSDECRLATQVREDQSAFIAWTISHWRVVSSAAASPARPRRSGEIWRARGSVCPSADVGTDVVPTESAPATFGLGSVALERIAHNPA
jgi:hypothetical protein